MKRVRLLEPRKRIRLIDKQSPELERVDRGMQVYDLGIPGRYGTVQQVGPQVSMVRWDHKRQPEAVSNCYLRKKPDPIVTGMRVWDFANQCYGTARKGGEIVSEIAWDNGKTQYVVNDAIRPAPESKHRRAVLHRGMENGKEVTKGGVGIPLRKPRPKQGRA